MSELRREPSWTLYFRCSCGWSRTSWHTSQQSAAKEQRQARVCPKCGKAPEYASLDKGVLSEQECADKYIVRASK